MNALLTPEQIDGIKKRDADDRLAGISLPVPMPQSMIDRHLLLRDREAIATKIEREIAELEADEWVQSNQLIGLRALVTAIRGEK